MLIVVGVGAVLGVVLGILAGGVGGSVDMVVSRGLELIQGFPVLLLAFSLVAILGPSLLHAMLAAAVAAVPDFARVTRGHSVQLRHREFIEAARSSGASRGRILFREMLPNMFGSLAVLASFYAALAIMYEAGISFLGLGVQPPTASFGEMLNAADQYIYQDPMYAVCVGAALVVVILGFNLLGDTLSDYFGGSRL